MPSTFSIVDAMAEAVAERLAAVLPPGFSATTQDGYAIVTDGRWTSGLSRSAEPLPPETQPDVAEAVARTLGALDAVQDFIAEETHEPWPDRTMPGAFARLEGRILHLGWGEHPLPSIDLDLLG